jgi:hypothetical protein
MSLFTGLQGIHASDWEIAICNLLHPLPSFRSPSELTKHQASWPRIRSTRVLGLIPPLRFLPLQRFPAPGSSIMDRACLTPPAYASRFSQPLDVFFHPTPAGPISCRIRSWGSALQSFSLSCSPVPSSGTVALLPLHHENAMPSSGLSPTREPALLHRLFTPTQTRYSLGLHALQGFSLAKIAEPSPGLPSRTYLASRKRPDRRPTGSHFSKVGDSLSRFSVPSWAFWPHD